MFSAITFEFSDASTVRFSAYQMLYIFRHLTDLILKKELKFKQKSNYSRSKDKAGLLLEQLNRSQAPCQILLFNKSPSEKDMEELLGNVGKMGNQSRFLSG